MFKMILYEILEVGLRANTCYNFVFKQLRIELQTEFSNCVYTGIKFQYADL